MVYLHSTYLWDLVIEVLGTTQRTPKPTQVCMRETDAEIQSTPKIKHVGSESGSIKRRSSSFERTSLWERITVVDCRRQRSCDKDDHQMQKPDEETRVPHPPRCSGLVV